MSLESSDENWCKNKKLHSSTEAFHEDDGAKNMAAIEKFIGEGKGTWEDFPLFKWAHDLGEGWYIPANEELADIVLAINGGTNRYNMSTVLAFNRNNIVKYGARSMYDDKGFAPTHSFRAFYSSTEADAGKAYVVWPNTDSFAKAVKATVGTSDGDYKGLKLQAAPQTKSFSFQFGTRAVHKF
jgi:hypothetical protein